MDVEIIKRKYRRNARFYDSLLERLTQRLRERAVGRLAVSLGDVVLDFGCGTGLSFDLLERAIGLRGHVIGVELSPDMLAQARERVVRHGWTNVTLIEANAEAADLRPKSVDAVLCFYTHDIMQSPRAIERAVTALRIGGRFVAAGRKRACGLCGTLLSVATLAYSLPFVTTLSGASRPWWNLEEQLGELEVEEHQWGSAYIAHGVKRASGEGRGAQ